MNFYAPQDPKQLKKERDKARDLKKTSWWNQKIQAGICYYCEKKFSKDNLTMDHKVPIARGGTSSMNNIVCCCKACNTKKKSLTSVDFISS
ncbi:MAG: HNH endonuclease [Bdellovibrionota bacterium]